MSKTRSNPAAVVVKLADRIANIEHGGKIGMYAKEYQALREALDIDGMDDNLWIRLEQLLKINN